MTQSRTGGAEAPRETLSAAEVEGLAARYRRVRGFTEALAAPLAPEDQVAQTMPDVSPTRWHLAHVTWFFEAMVLREWSPGYRAYHPAYHHLFNSYYNTLGEQWPRPRRGELTRPTVAEVHDYRAHVDAAVEALLEGPVPRGLADIVTLGLHHEQQHQELILTDIKHVLAQNPLHPAYRELPAPAPGPAPPLAWESFPEGLVRIGHDGGGFAYDNEGPRHRVFVEAFELANRPVTNGEYLAFVEDGGYRRPELWLSDAWMVVPREGWEAPIYWRRVDGAWHEFTLAGLRPLDLEAPVSHLSYYEADAYARWAGARLPTEAEWEVAAAPKALEGNFVDADRLHPEPQAGEGLGQLYGDVWEWTMSAYGPYPGYRQAPGPLGEYNGKFMCSQMVLRGGSCLTSRDHVRPTYRNFFPPDARWQMTGLRLARDA